MAVTREVVVSGTHAAASYEDGKYTATGEVSVHFSVEGDMNFHGPGSAISATITMSKDEAAVWSVGKEATLTIEPK